MKRRDGAAVPRSKRERRLNQHGASRPSRSLLGSMVYMPRRLRSEKANSYRGWLACSTKVKPTASRRWISI